MKIVVIHGPNLNLLGQREPAIYGTLTLAEIDQQLARSALEHKSSIEASQYNGEGEIVTALHSAQNSASGIILNPGGYAHTSVAIHDAISAISIPVIEVHLSNTLARESFRHASLTAGACRGLIAGFGWRSYQYALLELIALQSPKNA